MFVRSHLVFAVACGSLYAGAQAGGAAEFLGVLRDAVTAADSFARADAPAGSATGPLFIDVESIRDAGRGHHSDTALTDAAIRRAIKVPHRSSSVNDAVLCEKRGYPCHVREDGVFLRLTSVDTGLNSLVLRATVFVTHPRYGGGHTLCPLLLSVSFVHKASEWKRRKVTLDSSC